MCTPSAELEDPEFTEALAELQQEGVLTHAVDTDTITLPDVN